MKSIRFFLLVALCVSTVAAQDKAPSNDSIRKEALRADLYFLGGDSLRGRLTDTPENHIAEDYIRSRFERAGLNPAESNNSYFQNYTLMTSTLGEGNRLQILDGENSAFSPREGEEFYPLFFSPNARARGSVVFAGFGITAPQLNHDDYRATDVRGKIVLILDHEPGERDPRSPFEGLSTSEVSGAWRKALYAQEKGAIGVLIVSDVHNHPDAPDFALTARAIWPAEPPRIRRFTLAAWAERIHIPVIQISPTLGAHLVRGSGKTLEDLSKSAEARGGAASVNLSGVEVEMNAAINRLAVADRSVLAWMEGSDPQLKNEYLIVCAHIDHDGADGPRIYNGADDDGSGIIGLLAIADAFAEAARNGHRPRRSILFAAWNSEERGLLGAWAYTENPRAPLEKISAVLNMDMIGRNEEVPEGGGARFRGLPQQTAESNKNAVGLLGYSWSASLLVEIKKANQGIGLDLQTRYDNNISNLVRRSDHWPFLNRGVPGIWFHTGLHPDYHTIYDRPEKINYDKMEKVARLVHQAGWNLANQDARPKLDGQHPAP